MELLTDSRVSDDTQSDGAAIHPRHIDTFLVITTESLGERSGPLDQVVIKEDAGSFLISPLSGKLYFLVIGSLIRVLSARLQTAGSTAGNRGLVVTIKGRNRDGCS